jgi:NADH-quinone oxidoreductase subunit J
MSAALFSYLSAAILTFSLLAVTRKNPVHAVLWMIVMFFHLASFYLALGAEFLAAVQVIVYAGAILVLFLFVVMVLNIKEEEAAERFTGGWPIGLTLVAGLLLLVVMMTDKVLVGRQGAYTAQVLAQETHTKALGKVLFTQYIFPFELASLILLVAIVGAIVLAKKRLV